MANASCHIGGIYIMIFDGFYSAVFFALYMEYKLKLIGFTNLVKSFLLSGDLFCSSCETKCTT